jgi:hypothetical protein
MRIAEVAKLTPQERFLYWIRERHDIYLRRKAKQPKPWTDDEILRSWKFCNVVRAWDLVSQWLLNNWYKPFKDHPNALVACSLARQLNNSESLGAIGFPERWEPRKVERILKQRAAEGKKNFSGAYMITGTLGGTKVEQIVWKVVDQLHKGGVVVDASSMENTAASLLTFNGFGHFIAGQVVADLRWALGGTWKDKDTWAPIGPGSRRGINRLHERPAESNLIKREFEEEFSVFLRKFRPLIDIPAMEAIDYQNCLCEWDKYERTLHGEGHPKQKYNGG